jgi:hypothetical protein
MLLGRPSPCGAGKKLEEKTDKALGVTALVLFAVLGLVTVARTAEETTGAREADLRKMVDVHDVRTQPDQVAGVLGGTEESPGRSTVSPQIRTGLREPFIYRRESRVPQRSDGMFEMSVSLVAPEHNG